MHNAEVLQQVEQGYRMPRPAGCPQDLYALMLECWQADESRRLSFEQIHARLEEYCEQRDETAAANCGGGRLSSGVAGSGPTNNSGFMVNGVKSAALSGVGGGSAPANRGSHKNVAMPFFP